MRERCAAQVFSENHIRQHERKTHSACPCCDAALGLLSASVSATRRRIRLRKLGSVPCRKWPRSVRYGSRILDRIRLGATSSASASLTVMRSFASRKHRLQWKQSASMNVVVIHPAPRQNRATTTHQRASHACEGSRSGSASRAPSSRMPAESFPRSGRISFPLLSDDRAIRQTVS